MSRKRKKMGALNIKICKDCGKPMAHNEGVGSFCDYCMIWRNHHNKKGE
jgi:hypothetical protein